MPWAQRHGAGAGRSQARSTELVSELPGCVHEFRLPLWRDLPAEFGLRLDFFLWLLWCGHVRRQHLRRILLHALLAGSTLSTSLATTPLAAPLATTLATSAVAAATFTTSLTTAPLTATSLATATITTTTLATACAPTHGATRAPTQSSAVAAATPTCSRRAVVACGGGVDVRAGR